MQSFRQKLTNWRITRRARITIVYISWPPLKNVAGSSVDQTSNILITLAISLSPFKCTYEPQRPAKYLLEQHWINFVDFLLFYIREGDNFISCTSKPVWKGVYSRRNEICFQSNHFQMGGKTHLKFTVNVLKFKTLYSILFGLNFGCYACQNKWKGSVDPDQTAI